MARINRIGLATALAAASIACNKPVDHAAPSSVPVAIDVTENAAEFDIGGTVEFTVSLTNATGAPAIAAADTPVTLASPGMPALVGVVKAGASSSVIHWRPDSAGLFHVTASANGLEPKATLVPVKGLPVRSPAAVTRPTAPLSDAERERARRVAVSRGPVPTIAARASDRIATRADPARAGDTVSVAGPPVPVGNEPAVLRMYIEPEPVDETNDTWTADISFMLQTASGALKEAAGDIPIALTCGAGRISPNQVVLPAGKATSRATPVRIVSDHSGEGRIRAASSLGSVEQVVRFRPAPPMAIAVNVSPARSISDGRSEASVTVRLVDSHNHARRADEDLEVDLITNVGKLKANTVVIAKGATTASTTISSSDRGVATITAFTAGLAEGVGTLTFTLPLLAVLFAVLGGVLGAFLRSGAPARARARKFVENLLIGGATGMVFWLILLFGALNIASAVLPFDPKVVPVANEAGALLLGVGGGWLGRRLFADKTVTA